MGVSGGQRILRGIQNAQCSSNRILNHMSSGDLMQAQRTLGIIQAEEARDEIIGGVGDELGASAPLRNAGALAQQDDLVTEQQGLIDVVSDENDGLGQIRLDADELALKLTAHERVDCAERLIHQQNTGVGGQRPGHPDALGLSAGELVGISLSEVTIQAQHVDQFQSTITGSSAIDPAAFCMT